MKPILQVENLSKNYGQHTALNNINFNLYENECLGIIGESGSGKTTLSKIIMGLEKASSGEVHYKQQNILTLKPRQYKQIYQQIQLVFQNSKDAFNPKIKLGNAVIAYQKNFNDKSYQFTLDDLFKLVNVDIALKNHYPHQVSGGQCQRLAIARALSIEPKILIFDEITSALDILLQREILQLLQNLKQTQKLTYLFISHDLSILENFCDRIIVMHKGNIIETQKTSDLLKNPIHSYTKELLSARLKNNGGK